MRQRNVVVALLVLGLLSVASAAPIGYWRFEGTAGNAIGNVPNVLNPGTHDGTGQNSAVYSGSTIGPSIWDPITGTVYSNATSLNASGSARVLVPDHDDLDAASFTIEAMIKVGADQGTYPRYVSHKAAPGWQMDMSNSERARARFDTSAQINQWVGAGAPQSLADLRWHHTAVTFDAATKLITHYTDYGVTATHTLNGDASEATAVAANLLIGDSSLPAGTAVDEVRYTEGVLSSSQFLRSVNNAVWSFEGTPGALVGVAQNRMNPGTLDGAGESGARYASDVNWVARRVYDPISGQQWDNTSSLDMNAGGLVRVLDADELDAPAFTIEAFVKVQDQGGYPGFITRLGGGQGWQLDVNPNEYARSRVDTDTVPPGQNQTTGSTAAQSLADYDWHHVAFTFDGATMRLYVDYGNLATRSLVGFKGDVTNLTMDLLMRGSGWPAGSYLDEVRFTASVLEPDQFLQGVYPEPGTLSLLAFGGLGALLRRRRRKR
ncbi:PEP-CTERM sorting domain-containing protein [bacterium]|nr:PEP-CTERM sorting domain-containing protein [bacterium]